jgi:hypothetical protein
LEFRWYKPGDESHILNLFKTVFGKDMMLDYWQWRFRDNPKGEQCILLAWDKEILVGHYAVSPLKLIHGDCIYKFALSMTTMVHPDWRNQKLFTRLASEVYQMLWKHDYAGVMGFPNDNSLPGFVSGLGWTHAFDIRKLRAIKPRFEERVSCSSIVVIETFDGEFDTLSQLPIGNVEVFCSSRYLNWRYVDNPINRYLIFVLGTSSLDGYCICSIYNQGSYGVECQIIDIRVINWELMLSLLKNVMVKVQQDMGIDIFTIWPVPDVNIMNQLRQLGFQDSNEITHFGGIINPHIPDLQKIWDSNLWFLTMGDSDNY